MELKHPSKILVSYLPSHIFSNFKPSNFEFEKADKKVDELLEVFSIDDSEDLVFISFSRKRSNEYEKKAQKA